MTITSIVEEELKKKIHELKEKYALEELKSILNCVKDPINKILLEKLLLGDQK